MPPRPRVKLSPAATAELSIVYDFVSETVPVGVTHASARRGSISQRSPGAHPDQELIDLDTIETWSDEDEQTPDVESEPVVERTFRLGQRVMEVVHEETEIAEPKEKKKQTRAQSANSTHVSIKLTETDEDGGDTSCSLRFRALLILEPGFTLQGDAAFSGISSRDETGKKRPQESLIGASILQIVTFIEEYQEAQT